MKPMIKLVHNTFKMSVNKTIAIMLLGAVVIINNADAQERDYHRDGGARPEANRQITRPPQQPNVQTNRQPQVRQERTQTIERRTEVIQQNRPQTTNNRFDGNRTPDVNNRIRQNNIGTARQTERTYTQGRTVQTTERTTMPTYNNGRSYRGVNRDNNYRRPGYGYSANNPSWHYSNLPRRNTVITTVPLSYRSINYGGYNYRYNNGVFYRPYNNIFRVVAPPIGIYINTLPLGYSRIYVGSNPYYYYNGTYYDYRDNNYLVVSPPVGAIVESLPEGYETVTIDGETYYMVDGAQYKPVVQENGEVWYEVVKAN